MGKFKITGNEWLFVIIMTLLAVIFTNQYWLRFLAQFNPAIGFLIYYIIVYTSLALMSYLGLVVFGVKIKHPLQIFGSGLIIFAFFLIFNWSSQYVSLAGAESAFWNNSEDGFSFYIWSLLIAPTTPARLWIVWALAFPITVFIMSLLGVWIVHRKPNLHS